MKKHRRDFLKAGATVAGGLWLGLDLAPAGETPKPYRAVVIGRTGGGDYGHGYDQIFKGLDNVVTEAIADPDRAGLRKAAERSGAKRQYVDYREMLQKEKPDLVCIASRYPDCHREMALAAIAVGRGLFIEKPLTETLADADAILAAAQARKVKIQVAHNRRYTSDFVRVRALLAEGRIGVVREVQIHGKQDARVGGEDMLVLGTHDFDLMRFYFGDPLWCEASVTAKGHDLQRTDVGQGREPMLVAGDTIHALFAFPNNVTVHWASVKTSDRWNITPSQPEKWAFEILGTKGIIAYQSGVEFGWLDSPYFLHQSDGVSWQPLPQPANWVWPEQARHPIKSLIHAIETDSEPVVSGADGRWAVEMVAAVYLAQIRRSRVRFPLAERAHPLRQL